MDDTILIILVVWLTIGIVIGGWISVDTFRRKVKGAKWVAIGVLLSVVGLLIYLMKRNTGAAQPRHHAAPEYKFTEPAASQAPPAGTGKATSEPAPVASQSVKEPVPEGQRPENTWAPHIKKQLEGTPRCQKCGAAVSSFDDICPDCGAKLK
jgi:hypothetical protein